MEQLKFALPVFFFLTISSAFAGRSIDYRSTQIDIKAKPEETYAIAVLDYRQVVIDRSQKPQFVGYLRSATAIAYPIITESKNPFADDVAFTIAQGIEKSGAKAIQIPVTYLMNKETILNKLKETGAQKCILLTLYEWRSDTKNAHMGTSMATEMIWNLNMQIYDSSLAMLAESKQEGNQKAEDPMFTASTKKAGETAIRYFKEKMELLFSSEDTASAMLK